MNNIVTQHWNSKTIDPEIDGVAPMGGGGKLEIYYRNYFEAKHFRKIIKTKDKTLLEIGCGAGRWALNLYNTLNYYEGIDISFPSIELAKNRIKLRGINNCKFYQGNIKDFNPAIKYDIIYFSGVTQYVESDELTQLIKIVKSWLKPEGIIIDRSTITLEAKTIIGLRGDYFSIYRTPNEIIKLFNQEYLKLLYQNRTYRFLRFNNTYSNKLIYVLKFLPSVLYYFLYFLTYVQDVLYPKIFREDICGKFSHDFFVFTENENK